MRRRLAGAAHLPLTRAPPGAPTAATYPGPVRAGAVRAAALAVLLLCVLLTTGMLVAPSSARADDPSWAEVQKAKRDVRAKASAVQRIQAALDSLEEEAARLGTVAVQRAAVASAAEQRLESAQAAVDRLQSQVAAAQKRAGTAKRTAGVKVADVDELVGKLKSMGIAK